LTFHLTGDYRRVEFEKHDFEVSDLAAIENALKQWVVLKLKPEAASVGGLFHPV
jgi:hypothetical protein